MEAAPVYTVVRPSPQQRAELLRSQRQDEKALEHLAVRKERAARQPVNGTSSSGEVLGGQAVLEPEDLRQVR